MASLLEKQPQLMRSRSGVTIPASQAAASLFQQYLPAPTVGQLVEANNLLLQLQTTYEPLVFRHGLNLKDLRIVTVSDSSLGKASKYSQGGHIIMLSEDCQDHVCKHMIPLWSRSSRSKRVAASTMAAETLAMGSGAENAGFIQTWLYEILHPGTIADLINLSGSELVPHDVCVDCNDLYETLVQPAFPNLSNKALTLYLAMPRELR